jgi:anti-anti-sigma regulatory factor
MLSQISHPLVGKPSLTIDIRSADQSQRAHVDLGGALVEPHAHRLHKRIIDLLRSRCPHAIDVDLASVTVIDSTGIAVLELCCEDARQLGCHITLRNLRPRGLRHDLGVGASPGRHQ